jgi:acetyl-CoA carboxylase carboxyl transferase subunit beta
MFRGLLRPAGNPREGEELKADDVRTCKYCKRDIKKSILRTTYHVCPECGRYFMIRARRRISMLADKGSFTEVMADMTTQNILSFPGYEEKLAAAKENSSENEAVICGRCEIEGKPCYMFIMEPYYMMASMGTVVGEKITALFEMALKDKLPVIGITASGGARMQEGMLSLMQMAKVSASVKRHSDAGLLYIVLLTNPTTGGVDASFAMQGDIILAEPGARVGFAGPRVIEQTYKRALPEGFQMAESVLCCGFIDAIVTREEQKSYIGRLLSMHGGM